MSKKYSVECETGAEWRCCLINEPFQALAFAMAAVNPSSAWQFRRQLKVDMVLSSQSAPYRRSVWKGLRNDSAR